MPNDAPIMLTREQHLQHLNSFWRQQQLDHMIDDVLYDDQSRRVSVAMAEPEPRPIDWTIARDLAGALVLNFAGLAVGGLILWEMLRPMVQQ